MTPHTTLIEPEVRRDLCVATAIAILATVMVHLSAYLWFPADLEAMTPFLYAMYGLMCFNMFLDMYAPLKGILIYEVLTSGFNAYWVTAACGPLSYMQITFLVLGLRSYLLFRRKKGWLVFTYAYYTTLFLIGHFADFWLPFIPEPVISAPFASSMADAVLIFQVPLLFIVTQTTIRRAHKEQTLIERFFQRNEDLRKTSSALKLELSRRDQLLHQVFDRAFDAQILVDEESLKLLDCNQQAVELVEAKDKKDLLGKTYSTFSPIPFPQNILPQLIQNKELTLELECVSLNGKSFWASATIRRFQLEGRHYHIIRIVDISATKASEILLREKNLELARYIDSNLQLENFAFAASHDLREPLRSIISFAQLLQKRYGDQLDDPGQEFLTHIIQSGQNMNSLIRALLAYSRINETEINLKPVNMDALVRNVQAELNSLLKEKNAHIHIVSLPHKIKGDQVRLQQLWQNLLTNALKFVPEGRTPCVELGLKEENPDGWTFFIRDNGIGIGAEEKEEIFLLFKRLHTQNRYDGNGIGLAMCRRIVQQHGGRIWLESTPGEGSTFYFTLPKTPIVAGPKRSAQFSHLTQANHLILE